MLKKIVYIAISILLISCEWLNPFEDEGDYTERRIELTNVTHVKNDNIFHIIFVKDTLDVLIFKGGENKIDKCSFEINGSQLIIDHDYKNNARNFEFIIAEIRLQTIDSITVNAPAEISSHNTLTGNELYVDVVSKAELVEMNLSLDYSMLQFHSFGGISGGFQFSGSTNKADYIMNGITNILATELKSDQVTIAQKGIGAARVWASEALDITFYNSGTIYYKGNPNLTIKRVKVDNQDNDGQVIPIK